jgi:hypothetical protein
MPQQRVTHTLFVIFRQKLIKFDKCVLINFGLEQQKFLLLSKLAAQMV